MIEDFVTFLKLALEKQHKEFVDTRLVTGNVGVAGYEKSIGILEALKATQSNLDIWAAEFKKSQGE